MRLCPARFACCGSEVWGQRYVQALVLIGVEMGEFAADEESLGGPARGGPIEEQGARTRDGNAGGTFNHSREVKHSLSQTPTDPLIGGLLVDLLMRQPGRRRWTGSRSDR
jgi:hypothetical protein